MALDMRRVLVAGLVSSVVMGMVSMMGEALLGAGFWAAPTLIAATVMRDLQTLHAPVPLMVLPLMLGLMGHMMNSVVLTGIFEAATGGRLVGFFERALVGMVFGMIVFGAMWFVVLPFVNPVMLLLNPVVFAVAHLLWGAALGMLLSTPAGQPARRLAAH